MHQNNISLYLVRTVVAALLGLGTAASVSAAVSSEDPASCVNPFAGTKGGGNVFSGAVRPFGMAQFTQNPFEPTGFVINMLSGTGGSNYGNFPVIPVKGGLTLSPERMLNRRVSFRAEKAHAGYYECLVDGDVKASLTVTDRTGIAVFEFPEGTEEGTVLVGSGISGSPYVTDAAASVKSASSFEGFARGGWFCIMDVPYRVYVVGEFDCEAQRTGTWKEDRLYDGSSFADGSCSGMYYTFDLSKNRTVRYKVALSYVSVENAWENLRTENPGWDFDAVRAEAEASWNDVLSKIEVPSLKGEDRTIFYTQLYHSMIHPNIFNDVNGEYIGADNKIHRTRTVQYTNFSNWDSYRNQIQLLAMLYPSLASDIVQSHYDFAVQAGEAFPRWVYANVETGIMQGDPTSILIANAWAFGARGYDPNAMLRIMQRNARIPGLRCQKVEVRPGLKQFLEKGWYPEASLHLEMISSDFAIGKFCSLALGDPWTPTEYLNRAKTWRNLFNPENLWIQSRDSEGNWADLYRGWAESTHTRYFWMVPYDIGGLVEAIGGVKPAEKRLDDLFDGFLDDTTAMKYTLSNEPSMHIPWCYNWVGRPDKASDIIELLRMTQYTNTPAGIPGNDDMGVLSAWYVFASMGIYPMIPGVGGFTVNTPAFPKVVIHRQDGDITILRKGTGRYISGLKVNGEDVGTAWIPWEPLADGGTIEFKTSSKPAAWGTSELPPSYD